MDADGPHIYKDKHAQINEFVYTKHECNKNTYSTGWRRLVGSLKLQIIFHQRATKYRALLLKMPYEDKGSYESSPPCTRGMECCVGEKGLEKKNKNYLCNKVAVVDGNGPHIYEDKHAQVNEFVHREHKRVNVIRCALSESCIFFFGGRIQ